MKMLVSLGMIRIDNSSLIGVALFQFNDDVKHSYVDQWITLFGLTSIR